MAKKRKNYFLFLLGLTTLALIPDHCRRAFAVSFHRQLINDFSRKALIMRVGKARLSRPRLRSKKTSSSSNWLGQWYRVEHFTLSAMISNWA